MKTLIAIAVLAANLTRVLTSRTVKKPMASVAPADAGQLMRVIPHSPAYRGKA